MRRPVVHPSILPDCGYLDGVLRAVRSVVVVLCLVSTACAGTKRMPPGPITSSEIASALTRPREHRDAPLGVRDTDGRPYALSLDEPVLGPTPPDGVRTVTSVRALSKGCEDLYGPAPAQDPCWLKRPFSVVPTTGADDAAASSGSDTGERVLAGIVIIGTISGTAYCSYKCPDPWDKAVPIAVGTLVLAAIVVGAVYLAKSTVVR